MTRKKLNGKRDRQKARDATSRPDTWSQEPKKQKLEQPAGDVSNGVTAGAEPDQMPSAEPKKDLAVDADEQKEGELIVPPTES